MGRYPQRSIHCDRPHAAQRVAAAVEPLHAPFARPALEGEHSTRHGKVLRLSKCHGLSREFACRRIERLREDPAIPKEKEMPRGKFGRTGALEDKLLPA
jgi:hypothetical protein